MRVFAEVAELLGDGDNTAANEGTFHNVRVQTGPDITECKPGQVVVDVKAACINYPDLLDSGTHRAGSTGPHRSFALTLATSLPGSVPVRVDTSTNPVCRLHQGRRQQVSSPTSAEEWTLCR